MLDLVLTTLLVAAGAVGLTIIVRNAPGVRRWVQEAKKPWACNVCMALWTTLVVDMLFVIVLRAEHLGLAFLPAYALAFNALQRMAKAPEPPTVFSLPEDSEDE